MTSEQEGRLSEIAKQINRTPPSRVPFEDLAMSVDDRHRPISRRRTRRLATRHRVVQPDPRYPATTDRTASSFSTKTCPCGLPFRLLDAVEVRNDDVLSLPWQTGGLVRVHSVGFHEPLDLLDVAGWQVRQHNNDLRILVASPGRTSTRQPPKQPSRKPSTLPAPPGLR
jgi:hypothetical protein